LTHIQVGSPIRPTLVGLSSGTIPMVIAFSCMLVTIRCAITAGLAGAAGPAGGVAAQNSIRAATPRDPPNQQA
jgi:hypothetical protein